MNSGLPKPPAGPILITGATGFLGRHVLRLGSACGAELHSYGRRSAGPLVTHHPGSMEDGEALRKVIAELAPCGIIHLAAAGVVYGASDVGTLLRANALPLTDLLAAAAALPGPPHVVCAGSGFEYAPLPRPRVETDPSLPNSAYGSAKAAATAIAASFASQVPVTVLRPFSIYGEGEPAGRLAPYIIARARAGEPVDLTAGEQLRDYTHAAEVAEGFWRVLADPPASGMLRLLNLATGRVVTLRAFGEALAAALARAGVPAELRFGARPHRADEMFNYTADVSALARTFGWVPTLPLDAGLDRMVTAHLALA